MMSRGGLHTVHANARLVTALFGEVTKQLAIKTIHWSRDEKSHFESWIDDKGWLVPKERNKWEESTRTPHFLSFRW